MLLKIVQVLRSLHREEEGFTLIELLIVIAIIAVIAAIAIPTVANRIDDAREAADRANVKLLQGLVDMHYIDEGDFPAEDNFVGYLHTAGYLNQELKSPYPNATGSGYTLKIDRTDPTRPVATVASTMINKWKGATATTSG